MPALKSKKQFVLLPSIVALLIGVFVLFQPANKESAADSPQAVVSQEDVLVEVDKDGHVVSMTVEHAKIQTDVNEFSYQLATA